MLIFFIFSIVCSQNIIIKNPSFEELDSNNKLLNWYNPENVEISSVISHSGKNSLHFKSALDRFITVAQAVNVEKVFQYEICAYVKFLNTIVKRTFGFILHSSNHTPGIYENYNSRSYYGFTEWKKICFKTGVIIFSIF